MGRAMVDGIGCKEVHLGVEIGVGYCGYDGSGMYSNVVHHLG